MRDGLGTDTAMNFRRKLVILSIWLVAVLGVCFCVYFLCILAKELPLTLADDDRVFSEDAFECECDDDDVFDVVSVGAVAVVVVPDAFVT